MTTAARPFTGTYTADPDHSSFQAQLRHMGVGTFRTGFEDVQARLEITDDGPRITGRASVASITIKRPAEFRAHIVDGADFFDAARYPHIDFASTRLDLIEDGAVALEGVLTMRGRDWGFDFQAQLPGGGDVLSWDVALSIHLELVAD